MSRSSLVDPNGPDTRPLPLLVVAAGPATAVAALRLRPGSLAMPPFHSWAELTRWYDAVPPQLALIAMVWCMALLLAGWLLVASALQVLRALPTLGRLGALADAISPRSLQRLGRGLAGLSLTAGLAAVVPGAGIPLTADGRSTRIVATDDDPSAPPAVDDGGVATLRRLGSSEPATEPARREEVTVAVGDSFWSLAVETLTDRVGAPPSDRQVVPYWRRLIEENRATLVDPANPDLIFPGQVFTLPPT